jgi:hypothetical protein
MGETLASERFIAVTGACQRQVVPDRGSIRLTAQAQDRDLKTATRDATRIYESLKEAVKKLSLDDSDLATSEYSVEEVKEWEENRAVSKGFRARMGLEVSTSAVQRLGEVISIASREGVKDVGALVSYVSHAKLRSEETACLEEAAKDARVRAEKLATALGADLGPVISISEGAGEDQSPMPRHMPLMMTRAAAPDASEKMAPPSVEPGKREVRVQARVVFSVK